MTDVQGLYFLYGALTLDDIGPLFAHQEADSYQDLARIYERVDSDELGEAIIDHAFALGDIAPVYALLAYVDDADRLHRWIQDVAQPGPHFYETLSHRNGGLAARLFELSDDNGKALLLANGGVVQELVRNPDNLIGWLRARFPAGSLYTDGELNENGQTFKQIVRSDQRGALTSILRDSRQPAGWLLALRVWLWDRLQHSAQPQRVTRALPQRTRLTKTETAEVNDIIAEAAALGRFDEYSADVKEMLVALMERSTEPCEQLRVAASTPPPPPPPDMSLAAAHEIATYLNEGRADKALEELANYARLAGQADIGLGKVQQHLMSADIPDDGKTALVVEAMASYDNSAINSIIQNMAAALNPDKLGLALASTDSVHQRNLRLLTQEARAAYLWHLPVDSPTFRRLTQDDDSADMSARRVLFQQLTSTLAGDMQEFHSLIGNWTGSLAELSDSIAGART